MKKLFNIIKLKGKAKENVDTINENIVDVNNIISDDLIEFTIDIGDYQPTKIYIKKDGQKRNQKKFV